jgi:hypothetical protein
VSIPDVADVATSQQPSLNCENRELKFVLEQNSLRPEVDRNHFDWIGD